VRLNRFGHETIHNLPIVFFSNRQAYVSALFDRLVAATVARLWSSGALASLVGPLQRSLAFLVVAVAIGVYELVARLQAVPISGEELLVIVFMLIRFNGPIAQINTLRAQLAVRLPQAESMLRIIKWTPPQRHPGGGTTMVPHDADIVFEGVSFTYRGKDRPALAKVSLTIEAGRTTSILGPSGSGKSTVVKLLGGLYEPDRGRILIGGVPLDQADLAQWRDGIAIVSQDYHLFEGSIADNIRFGKLDATDAEIAAAARLANAHEFVAALPRGYQSVIGEGGAGLSGGQKQRIQIARAFISRPKVLILDEATSAQDALSEREVIDAIRSLGRAVTVIIISHRLSSLAFADYSYVLDRGHVVEEGDSQTLIQARGLYYRMNELQLGGDGRQRETAPGDVLETDPR
jgi:ABC-type multidrug transport system fused ATPase/permease subunit